MCVLLLHHRSREDWPLVLLANRDESFDRPFAPPEVRDALHGVVAPRDLRAGGTWLGLNRHGLVAALTNRPGEDARPTLRSRGLLVGDVLLQRGTRDGATWVLDHLARTAYAGFHLVLADGREAYLVRHRGAERPTVPGPGDVMPLPPGAHVFTNLHEPDELELPEEGRAIPGEPLDALLTRLERLAGDQAPRLPRGHRILKREAHRGTVCSALVAVPAAGAGRAIFRFAPGAPDRVPFAAVRLPP